MGDRLPFRVNHPVQPQLVLIQPAFRKQPFVPDPGDSCGDLKFSCEQCGREIDFVGLTYSDQHIRVIASGFAQKRKVASVSLYYSYIVKFADQRRNRFIPFDHYEVKPLRG